MANTRTESEKKLFFLILAIIGVWFLYVMFILPLSDIQSSLQQQISYTKSSLGQKSSDLISNEVNHFFNEHIVKSGLMQGSYNWANKHGAASTQIKLWDWKYAIKNMLKTFWYLIYFSIYRFWLFLIWIPYLFPIILAITIDALVRRKISKWRYEHVSTFKHSLAQKLLFRLINISMLIPFLPIPLSPLLIPVGFLAFAYASRVFILNIGKRI